jgi:hypothetical protein
MSSNYNSCTAEQILTIDYDTEELSDVEDSEELKDIVVEKSKEFDKLPIDPNCTCKKMYNCYVPKPCKCSNDMKARNKCCESCNITQRRSCHYSCAKNSLYEICIM